MTMRINAKARQYLLIQQALRIARNVAARKAAVQAAPDYFSHAATTGRSGSMRELARIIRGRNTLQRMQRMQRMQGVQS
jgi:hypothetical protein